MEALKILRRVYGIEDHEDFPAEASWFLARWASEDDLIEVFEMAARSSEEYQAWLDTLEDHQIDNAAQAVETALVLAVKEARASAHEEWGWQEELRLAA